MADKRTIECLSIFLIRDLSDCPMRCPMRQCQASKTTGKQCRYQLPIDLSIAISKHTLFKHC